jgi:hypothetical protein
MPFTSTSVSVGTTAVEILPTDPRRRRFSLHNATGAGTTYVGGSGVTTSNGFDIVSGERLHFVEAHPGDCSIRGAVYAVNSSGTNTVRILVGSD